MAVLRRNLNATTVIAVLALAFAMTGGAWAASKYVITSTSQIKPSVLKKLKGKAGPQGSPGANGQPGAAGSKGGNGSNGESVAISSLTPGVECPQGGAKFSNGTGVAHACNGETGFTESVPSGGLLTGAWTTTAITGPEAITLQFVPVSFPFPLSSALTPSDVHFVALGAETGEGPCPGSIEEPEAEAGELCVYTANEEVAPESAVAFGGAEVPKPGTSGAILKFTVKGFAFANGTWAVTAP